MSIFEGRGEVEPVSPAILSGPKGEPVKGLTHKDRDDAQYELILREIENGRERSH